MTDLETAIERIQEAVDTTPADHPNRAGRLQDLGTGYHARYLRTKAMTDLETVIQQYQDALDNSSSPVKDRLRPGKILFTLHAEARN